MKGRAGKVLRIMVLMAAMVCLVCPAAFASDTVDIYVNNTLAATYDTTDLGSFTQQDNLYSSYYCKTGIYRYFRAVGPSLADVLDAALIEYNANHGGTDYYLNDLDYLNFYDGTWNTGNIAWSAVRDGVYYETPGGDSADVDPIIAFEYGEDDDPLSDTNCLRNFHGQPSGSPGDDTMSEWCKDLDDIYLTFN
jgi:hypothetical protein